MFSSNKGKVKTSDEVFYCNCCGKRVNVNQTFVRVMINHRELSYCSEKCRHLSNPQPVESHIVHPSREGRYPSAF